MTKRSLSHLLFVVVVIAGLLAACSGPAVPQVSSETQVALSAAQTLTAMPTATVPPTATQPPTAVPPTATKAPTNTARPKATLAPVGPTNFPAGVNPLTGLPVDDPALLQRAPVAIKVSNYPAAGRPHAGLSSADLVFEYYIGAGTNRFLAIFYGQNAEKVGPIRSARLVDAQLVPMYNGVLGFAYADPKVFEKVTAALPNRYLLPGGTNCSAICDNGEGTVMSVFANTENFTQTITRQGGPTQPTNLEGMRFEPTAPQGGQEGKNLTIYYGNLNRGQWKYDPASGGYLRFIEEIDAAGNLTMVPLPDRNTNQQLNFANVMVLFGSYIEYAPTLHDITMAGNTTGMRAMLFRDGKLYDGVWKSAGPNRPLQFFTKDGQPLALKPGSTWFAVMGANSGVQENQPGVFEVTHYMP